MNTYSDGTGTDQRALGYESAFFLRHTTVPKRAQSLDELSIPEVDRWSWTYIQRPYRDRIFESASAWRDWLFSYLRDLKRNQLK